jgi:hypothetical protein
MVRRYRLGSSPPAIPVIYHRTQRILPARALLRVPRHSVGTRLESAGYLGLSPIVAAHDYVLHVNSRRVLPLRPRHRDTVLLWKNGTINPVTGFPDGMPLYPSGMNNNGGIAASVGSFDLMLPARTTISDFVRFADVPLRSTVRRACLRARQDWWAPVD